MTVFEQSNPDFVFTYRDLSAAFTAGYNRNETPSVSPGFTEWLSSYVKTINNGKANKPSNVITRRKSSRHPRTKK